MALIEVFHLVASEIAIDTNAAPDIPQGSVVTLDTDGFVTVAAGTAAIDRNWPIGLAGDSRSQGVTGYTPESGSALGTHVDGVDADPTTSLSGSLILGAWGDARRYTQNRVADNFNETLASGKMTVYHSGGEFFTDQFRIVDNGNAQTYSAGAAVLMSLTAANAGKLVCASDISTSGYAIATAANVFSFFKNKVGVCLRESGADGHGLDYPSGVPGTDTPFTHLKEGGNSMTYGKFLHIKLDL